MAMSILPLDLSISVVGCFEELSSKNHFAKNLPKIRVGYSCRLGSGPRPILSYPKRRCTVSGTRTIPAEVQGVAVNVGRSFCSLRTSKVATSIHTSAFSGTDSHIHLDRCR